MSSNPELPGGTVTFLFTDIEGSTRLLKLWRDRYAEALADHRRIMREGFAEHSGHEIDTQGDSFFVAFRRARDAVVAAAECQRRLAAHRWPDGGQLRVRMGIHTGEPVESGGHYVGLGVHRAARICSAGHGGQVLVSQTTRELLRDDPVPNVTLRDLGEHRLKDMDDDERLYQLLAPELDADFPPLKTAASVPFGGQEDELAAAVTDEMGRPRWRSRKTWLVAIAAGAVVTLAVAGAELYRSGDGSAAATIAPDSLSVIDATGTSIESSTRIGTDPGEVAVGGGSAWVVTPTGSTASKVELSTGAAQTVQVGAGPDAVAVGGGAAWIANGSDGTVSRIPLGSVSASPAVHVGNGPAAVAYGDGAVWVANSIDGTVVKLNARTGSVQHTWPAIRGGAAIAYGFGRVWVASPSQSKVVALTPATGSVQTVDIAGDPVAIAIGTRSVWVADRSAGTVSKITPRGSPLSQTGTTLVGGAPDALAVAGGVVWVANGASGTLSKVAEASGNLTGTVDLGNPPEGMAIDGSRVYVTVGADNARHRGGTLSASGEAPDSIDPAAAYTAESWSILSLTGDGLMAYRRVGGIGGEQVIPDLATALPSESDGGRAYTFVVRRGVEFSDGTAVEPNDFRTAIERVYEVGMVPSAEAYYRGIVGAGACRPGRRCDLSRGIEVNASARTVIFHLVRPDPDFLDKLALPFADAVPTDTSTHWLKTTPVPATGPYMITAYRTNVEVRLRRNPHFHSWSSDARPAGYPDRIVWHDNTVGGLADAQAVAKGSSNLGLDVNVPPLTTSQLNRLETDHPGRVRLSTLAETTYFFLNTAVAPFDNLDARRAVAYAFDRAQVTAQTGPTVHPTCNILPPNFPAYSPSCPFDAAGQPNVPRAQALVKRSDTAGVPVTVWAPQPRAQEADSMATLLRTIGYTHVSLKTPPLPVYFATVEDSRTRTQIGFTNWNADFPSAGAMLQALFGARSFTPDNGNENSNPSELLSSAIDRMLDRAEAVEAVDPARATPLWQRAEKAILELAPVIPTYNKADVALLGRHVGNYEFNPEWGVLLDQLWVR